MVKWLQVLGLVKRSENGVVFYDSGDILEEDIGKWIARPRTIVFLGDTSPVIAVSVLNLLKKGSKSQISLKNLGYRNACAVLNRFGLIKLTSDRAYQVLEDIIESPSVDLIWNKSGKEESVAVVIKYLTSNPSASSEAIGNHVGEVFSRKWKETSWKRVGNALLQWAQWHMIPLNDNNIIPLPPGLKNDKDTDTLYLDFWNL